MVQKAPRGGALLRFRALALAAHLVGGVLLGGCAELLLLLGSGIAGECAQRRLGDSGLSASFYISTDVKVFSLAESQAELILKMYSMSTYSADFVIENGDNFRVSGARVPTARPSPPARARS